MMTPMVDVVFQLIVFFVLVIDFSRAIIEEMKLPIASNTEKISYAQDVLIVNILKDGMYKINGRIFYDPDRVRTAEEERMAFLRLEELFTQRRLTRSVPGTNGLVDTFMIIRADRSTDFEAVQRLMMMATVYGGITRVAFSAMPEKG
jgi:biopolymer transport protein ExbD